jgi:hypothetical protein
MNGIALPESPAVRESRIEASRLPLIGSIDLWWAAIAGTLIPVSLFWDFSWESSIGVDRFWSPPHLATHIGVWLSGLLGARLLMRFSLARRRHDPDAGARLGVFCAPSGAWLAFWGALLMQAAFLLDNWWQQTYGLGAGLWPPPQILKTIGFFAIFIGGVLLCVAGLSHNPKIARIADALLYWHGGLLLAMVSLVLTMTNLTNKQHTAFFYLISCAIYPAILIGIGQTRSARWGTTQTALAYTAIVCAMVWVLPLFPARPLTPPIHNPLDRMMPPQFPLLLIAPAVVMDLLHRQIDRTTAPWRVFVHGIIFIAVFVPAQWFFARFLLSSEADNWFFAGGGRHWPYFLKIDRARVMFWGTEGDPLTWRAVLMTMILATASAWIGLGVAKWLSKVRR